MRKYLVCYERLKDKRLIVRYFETPYQANKFITKIKNIKYYRCLSNYFN